MKHIKRIFLGALVFIIVVILGLAYVFVSNKNKIVSIRIGENVFKIEIAETIGQKARGLGYRDGLAIDRGMLFNFETEDKPGFWMMGMRFPIDILWIKNNKIVGIEKNVLPPTQEAPENALKLYYPPEAIDKVLEINAGSCDKLGIEIGSTVEYIGF
jgi:hypothetical protein